MNTNYETITLAGGCFWCLEAVYDEVKGVLSVDSGYSNGNVPNPSYKDVCTGLTGHAEVVQIKFDPNVISVRDILNVFFGIHDPTTLNRQGADVGTQYRSGIYYHTPEQKEIAENLIKELTAQKIFDNPIVTEVEAIKDFYIAENYHQEYYVNNKFQ
ncbi:MAG TPA: peptide-methionine (S)-S-oxide reductase MsrA, partial [Anaerolineales bacterium]|nr:peptide-methionine (S)-S-oxide reductase MsrA [Anaerolineales bacterium]